MRLACLQENLKRGLAIVSHAVASRSTLPVLSNILLSTEDGRLRLAANNLEISITVLVGARIDEDGAVTVPAKLLTDLIGNLPNDTVELELDSRTQTLAVVCRGTKAAIKGIEADEFPAVPVIDAQAEPLALLPPGILREVIGQVALAAAVEHTNPILQGVLLRLNGIHATFAAIDGYRLAVRTIELPEPARENIDIVIPARALTELGRTVGDADEPVAMLVTNNNSQVIFHTDMVDFVSRVIDGKFPDYERFVPQKTPDTTRTVLTTDELLKAVKRVALFSQAAGNIVTLSMEGRAGQPGHLTLSATANEVGETLEQVDALLDGEGGKLALNVKYLQEALSVINSDQVALETQSPNSPGVFRPVGGPDYLHLVMPMRIP